MTETIFIWISVSIGVIALIGLICFSINLMKNSNINKEKENTMLNDLIKLFKENPYTELSNIAQAMTFILTTFSKDKFINGESDRDAAIDALCQLLQSHKSNAPK